MMGEGIKRLGCRDRGQETGEGEKGEIDCVK